MTGHSSDLSALQMRVLVLLQGEDQLGPTVDGTVPAHHSVVHLCHRKGESAIPGSSQTFSECRSESKENCGRLLLILHHREGATSRGLPDVLLVVVALRDNRHLISLCLVRQIPHNV